MALDQSRNPGIDLSIRLHHRRHTEVTDALLSALGARSGGDPLIVPFLGPTRCGKSQVIVALSQRRARVVTGPGNLIAGADFRVAAIPPRPNERDIYKALLRACDYDCPDREKTEAVRRRAFGVIRDHGIRMIALDEVNHLAESGANVPHRAAADHFKSIADETGVGLILTGLPKFQTIIDGNEQFRDRCHATVHYLPYDWHEEADRSEFFGAVVTALDRFRDAGIAVEIDEFDATRRLYAASGGRVGMMLWLMSGSAALLGEGAPLRIEDIAAAAVRMLQKRGAAEFLAGDAPEDRDLFRAYLDILKEADLKFLPRGARDLEAMT
jgi:hypothetical protein